MTERSNQEQEPRQLDPEREETRPRIYVASLSDYNEGRLHGRWLDATSDTTTLQSGIHRMLATSPSPGAEEFAIHDYDHFGGLRLGEYESLETIVRLARGLRTHGPAFTAWAGVCGVEYASERNFRNHYLGTYASLAAFAEEYALDLGAPAHLEAVPAWMRPYTHFDAEGLVRDAVLSGDWAVVEVPDAVHVFTAPEDLE